MSCPEHIQKYGRQWKRLLIMGKQKQLVSESPPIMAYFMPPFITAYTSGLSNFNVLKTKRILRSARIKPAVNQVELHP